MTRNKLIRPFNARNHMIMWLRALNVLLTFDNKLQPSKYSDYGNDTGRNNRR